MSDYRLEVRTLESKFLVVSSFKKIVSGKVSLKSECKKAAESIYKKNKKSGVVLFVENTFESLILLESFLAAGAKFEVCTLSCGRVASGAATQWRTKLESLGIRLHDVNFDYKNPEHMATLVALQQQYNVSNMDLLFRLWAACHFDQFVVFPGAFCLPEIDSTKKILSWNLPAADYVAAYKFSESFDIEPSFLTCNHGLFKAQVESDFVAAYTELNKAENRGFIGAALDAKKVWFEQSGFSRLVKWPVREEPEAIWQAGLRFEDRAAQEAISSLNKKTRQLAMPEVQIKHEKGQAQPKKFSKRNASMAGIYKKLKSCSHDLINTGAIVPVAKTKTDSVYAAFPMLFTEHFFQGDLKMEHEFVKQLPFYPNSNNLISGNDLHLLPELAHLTDFFNEKIRKYFEIQGCIVNEFEIMQCWANKSKANMDHHAHRHPNSILSGVFYFNDGDGDTVFSYDPHEARVIRPSHSKPTYFNSRHFQVRPEVGKLILFPSHLIHRVQKHLSDTDDRITVAFNVFCRGVIGDFNDGAWLDLRAPDSKK